jgi:hypothetical protein
MNSTRSSSKRRHREWRLNLLNYQVKSKPKECFVIVYQALLFCVIMAREREREGERERKV